MGACMSTWHLEQDFNPAQPHGKKEPPGNSGRLWLRKTCAVRGIQRTVDSWPEVKLEG